VRHSYRNIIIIIMWLVLWWTLPFLRACSMLADSELGDRQLPDQCSGAPGQIQWSVTMCVVVGPGAKIITSDKGEGKCVCPRSFVCLFVCLSVSKITQKRVHGFG